MRQSILSLSLLAAFAAVPSLAIAANQTINVQFPQGGTGKAYDGRVTGNDVITYKLRASAGQTLGVTLSSPSTGTNFVVVAPDGEAPMYDSASGDSGFQRVLESSGVYSIQVYQMRNVARRGTSATYIIDFNVSGGSAATRPSRPADYADGRSGGPDFWVVSGVSGGDYLNLRAAPNARAQMVGQVSNGMRLRNLQCNGNGWCKVEMDNSNEGNPNVTGWAAQRYLREP